MKYQSKNPNLQTEIVNINKIIDQRLIDQRQSGGSNNELEKKFFFLTQQGGSGKEKYVQPYIKSKLEELKKNVETLDLVEIYKEF